jgi:hypothetical protein
LFVPRYRSEGIQDSFTLASNDASVDFCCAIAMDVVLQAQGPSAIELMVAGMHTGCDVAKVKAWRLSWDAHFDATEVRNCSRQSAKESINTTKLPPRLFPSRTTQTGEVQIE